MRQAKPLVPRWRKPAPAPQMHIHVGRRAARSIPWQTAAPAEQPVKPTVFRHRHQVTPVAWGVLVAVTGLSLHLARTAGTWEVVTGLIAAALIWLATRRLDRYGKRLAEAAAVLTALWLPLMAALGPRPWLALYAACWLVLTLTCWAHYRVRPVPERPADEIALWAATLGAEGSLAGSSLSRMETVGDGARYKLALVRGKQDTSAVFSAAKKIASLYGKPVTEAFPERHADGREHEAVITILKRNTLEQVREWDGSSIDPATGLAVIGDYPDGAPALYRFWSPGSGASQSVVAGTTGSGKTSLLYEIACIALTSEVPVIPVVLDPQYGQSLPDLRGSVPYARSPDQCFVALQCIDAGMTARSDHMADLAWTDEEGIVHAGMDHYDPHRCGLPLILVIFDEAHVLIQDPVRSKQTVAMVGKLAKLNRKAGGQLVVASHGLLLSELGDNIFRSMLVSGNAIALRTGETFTGSNAGLMADPRQLPQVFPDGSPTHGLGYVNGPGSRPDSPMRTRYVPSPAKVALAHKAAEFDPVFGDAFRSMLIRLAAAGQPGARELCPQFGVTGDDLSGYAEAVAAQAASAAAPDDSPAPGGRTASDAIIAVLTRPMTRGEILAAVEAQARAWDREPWSLRAVTGPLAKLADSGRIARVAGDGQSLYAPLNAP